MPKVSVLLPVFNAARYLPRALASILAQTERDFELIAVDDGSTDRSLPILQAHARQDARVRVISRSNTGIVGALTDGLAACTAPWIARMDADDWCAPSRLERQLRHLATVRGCVALGTWVMFTDPEGRPLKTYQPPTGHAEIEAELCGGNGGALVHPSCIFSRDALLASGGYRGQSPSPEDLDLFVRLLDHGQLANLPEVLFFYRQHAASITHQAGAWDALRAEITRDLRARHGLAPLPARADAKASARVPDRSDYRRRWALYAVEGGHLPSAWANLALALLRAPWKRENFSALGYLLHLWRNGAAR